MLRQINDNVIAVKLPSYASDIEVKVHLWYYDPYKGKSISMYVPPGPWKILGKLDELTDQDKKKVVDIINYATTATVELSIEVFCKVNKLYSVNPLGEKLWHHSKYAALGKKLPNHQPYSDYKKAWQESESNTGDWLIILREGE
jgi:hypothetical protein